MRAPPAAQDVYVITNDHARGKGVTNALMPRSMVTGRNVEAPRLLFQQYAEVLGPYAHPVDLFPPPTEPPLSLGEGQEGALHVHG